ncbi:MAG: hypothetical protein IR164_03390 [Devosia sp.]|jgi:hypothetical protein|uniref:hypothetical protein n=1 Tax=unclassified Devosia TaxID=196773 RepID=UPI001A0396D9|nr:MULTISPECIES: hypothetical protein [unclassified Devosia]MBF0677969.1 hypothetical protein [Devosia sp.]WEJ32404.1 hypothetical protein NYQ88_16125 [Devosia sp. SD17-2]
MNKGLALFVCAGLVSLVATLPSAAQRAAGNNFPNQRIMPTQETNCADDMGHMRSVRHADIAAINGQRVALIPVCEDLSVAGKNAYGALFVNGNVNHLRGPIGQNVTLMGALAARGYDEQDVVSLRFGGGNSVVLYVYQRDAN